MYASELSDGCEIFLQGLVRAPGDEMLRRGFEAGQERFKYWQPTRWYQWPFAPQEVAEEEDARATEPPGQIPPVECSRRSTGALELAWHEYVPRPVIETGGIDICDGFHLEVCHVCPIDGPAEWVRAYKGRGTSHVVRGLTLAKDLRVRVRGYNRKGGGEWSEEVQYRVLAPPPPVLVEHYEIPFSWRTMDIEDVVKNEKLEGEEMAPQLAELVRGLFDVLHEHRTTIKVCFRYYSLVGAAAGSEADSMSMQQFLNFAKGSRLLEDGAARISASDIDRIFLRSVRNPELGKGTNMAAAMLAWAPSAAAVDSPERATLLAAAGAPAAASAGAASSLAAIAKGSSVKAVSALSGGAPKGKGANIMYQHHFVGGLIRICAICFASRPQFRERMEALCELIAGHVHDELDLLHDWMSKLMALQPFVAVYRKRRSELEKVFRHYAAADQAHYKQLGTINLQELTQFAEDCKLFDTKFGLRDLVSAFVRVNIEDDIYVQEDKSNTSSELVYDEFFEALARMFHFREGGERKKKAKRHFEEDEGCGLARRFDVWLQESVLPPAFEAIRNRKKPGG